MRQADALLRRRLLRSLGFALGLAVVVAAPLAARATQLHQTPRVPAFGGSAAYAGFQWKPYRIIYSGDGAALLAGRSGISSHLTWTSWTQTVGRAWGADWHNNCVPDCARGTYSAYRANIRVYRPRQLGGYLLFTRMTVTYKVPPPPYLAYRHGFITFKLDYSAPYNTFFWNA